MGGVILVRSDGGGMVGRVMGSDGGEWRWWHMSF